MFPDKKRNGSEAPLARLLSDIMSRYSPVSVSVADEVARAGVVRDLVEREVLVRMDTTDQQEYFVLDGMLHRVVIGQEGEDITTDFIPEGSVAIPHFARTRNGVSRFTLQALTRARVFQVPVQEFDRLRGTNEHLRAFGMRVVEQELIGTIRQATAFREHGARERLIALRKALPGLENRVPHGTIASFLGITPVSFSRLRNDLARTA